MIRLAFAVACLELLWACGGARAPDCTLVATPAGLFPKACVIEVPTGATVSQTDGGVTVVTVDGGIVATYPPCACPAPDASSSVRKVIE
jgi:hypothetical protein